MCLIAWRTAPASAWPLVLAANRDEFHARPALALHRWEAEAGPEAEAPGTSAPETGGRPATIVMAGKDVLGGGTWLGLASGPTGLKVAMLTNIRDGRARAPAADAPSRGLLVKAVLESTASPHELMSAWAGSQRLREMAGFNLVAIEVGGNRPPATTWLAHRAVGEAGRAVAVEAGVHGLSNAALDSPWPKSLALVAAVAAAGEGLDAAEPYGSIEARLLGQLADRREAPLASLPDTGIDIDRERWLSSAFLVSEHYGTRCSSVLAIHASGSFRFLERRFDASGQPLGETALAG